MNTQEWLVQITANDSEKEEIEFEQEKADFSLARSKLLGKKK